MSRADKKDDVDVERWPPVERLAVLGISRAGRYRLGHLLGATKVGARALRIPPQNIRRVLGPEAYDAIMGISEPTPEQVEARSLLKTVVSNLLARARQATPETPNMRSHEETPERQAGDESTDADGGATEAHHSTSETGPEAA